jgi:hypothetical protein
MIKIKWQTIFDKWKKVINDNNTSTVISLISASSFTIKLLKTFW